MRHVLTYKLCKYLRCPRVEIRAGAITSRLSADTTTISDQISLNTNVVVRSITQAAMVLVFMVHASWRLTVTTSCLAHFWA